MCPLCLVNLQRAAGGTMRFRDISDYLARASGARAVEWSPMRPADTGLESPASTAPQVSRAALE
jgi:hypothetical protein